jgi:hypothetical protein
MVTRIDVVVVPPPRAATAQPAKPRRDRRGQNATVVFPAPLMSTIGELGAFLAREAAAAAPRTEPSDTPLTAVAATPNGSPDTASVSAN